LTAGAGIEAAFGENLSAGLQNSVCTSSGACGLDPGGNPNDTVKFSANMIRLGITYKFR
jgi:opacity protein-like surface antigen